MVTVANIDGTGVRTIESPRGLTLCAPRWSPDGTKLVYQARDGSSDDDVGNLYVHDLTTGQTTQVTHLELTKAWWWFLYPSFSQHGDDSVIFHMPRTSSPNTQWDAWSVPATGGEPRLMMRNASWPMTNPGAGPDTFAVQFLEPSASDLAGRSIMTGHPCCRASARTLVQANESIWWPTVSPAGNLIAYQDAGYIYVLDIADAAVLGEGPWRVAIGGTSRWVDHDTLLVTP